MFIARDNILFRKVSFQAILTALCLASLSMGALGQKRELHNDLPTFKAEQPTPETTGCSALFTMTGSTATDGADGNIRTYTAGGINVKASGIQPPQQQRRWETAFLGVQQRPRRHRSR